MKNKTLFFQFMLILIVAITFFSSCTKEKKDIVVYGMAPIYLEEVDTAQIRREDPRAFSELGILVTQGNYLFINERYQGIHVIDNTDPSNPVNKHFWRIPGNQRFVIKGDLLYADNSINLLTIDVSDYRHIKVIDTDEDYFIIENDVLIRPPLDYSGPFECFDSSKGILLGWAQKELKNPKCNAY